jgi:DNA-binding response OmpR family regulator
MKENKDSFPVLHVLSLEDSVMDFEIIRDYLEDIDFQLHIERTVKESDFTALLHAKKYDIILADFNLPGFDAFSALEISKKLCPGTPFIVVSGAIGEETAIELLKQGAVDFIMKDKLDRLAFVVDRALEEAKEKLAHKNAEIALSNNLSLTDATLNSIHNGILVVSPDGKVIKANAKFAELWRIPDDLLATNEDKILLEFVNSQLANPDAFHSRIKELYCTPDVESNDIIDFADGRVFERISRPMYVESEYIGRVWSFLDITQRKHDENHAILSSKILNLLNSNTSLAETIQLILNLIHEAIKIEAIGIRLKKGNDYPYFNQLGFQADFIRTENSLLSHTKNGGLCYDKNGRQMLDCTCGLVISGKTDPVIPYYSEGGSFWTTDSSQLLSLPIDDDLRFNPRNRCILDGYNSIAIIPVRAENEIVGLLQLNDTKKGRFNPEMIRFLESIGNILGVAFMRKQAQEELEKSHDLLFKLSEQVPGVIYQYQLFPDGRSCFPYSSSGMNFIYECTPEEVREDATPVFGRLHPEDYDRVAELIFESARNLSHFNCEFRVNLPRQGLRWRYSDAVPELMEDKSVLWHGIIYDITKIKEAESDLNKKMDELVRFHNLTVDREIYMIDLKKEVNDLLSKLGQPAKYRIVE